MTANGTGRANRVAPDGTFHGVADRGLLWGNRGQLLNTRGELARTSNSRAWIVCVLEFKGWQRTQWQVGRLTELYFLDEATAFAAGHRPCALCRRDSYNEFKRAWTQAYPDDPVGARHLDRRLHEQRSAGTHRAALADLPDGTIFSHDAGFWLVRGDRVQEWTFGGYRRERARTDLPRVVDVRTPEGTVHVLRAGYRPVLA